MQAAGRRPASVALVSAQLDDDEEVRYYQIWSRCLPRRECAIVCMHVVMSLCFWLMFQEEPSAYDLLVSSLQPLKRARVEAEESGKESGESVRKEEEAELSVVDSGEEESDSDREAAASTGRGGWGWPASGATANSVPFSCRPILCAC